MKKFFNFLDEFIIYFPIFICFLILLFLLISGFSSGQFIDDTNFRAYCDSLGGHFGSSKCFVDGHEVVFEGDL